MQPQRTVLKSKKKRARPSRCMTRVSESPASTCVSVCACVSKRVCVWRVWCDGVYGVMVCWCVCLHEAVHSCVSVCLCANWCKFVLHKYACSYGVDMSMGVLVYGYACGVSLWVSCCMCVCVRVCMRVVWVHGLLVYWCIWA